MSTFVFLLPVQLLGKAHNDCDNTVVITAMHWRLLSETHPGSEVVSIAIIFVFPSADIDWFDSAVVPDSIVVTWDFRGVILCKRPKVNLLLWA